MVGCARLGLRCKRGLRKVISVGKRVTLVSWRFVIPMGIGRTRLDVGQMSRYPIRI